MFEHTGNEDHEKARSSSRQQNETCKDLIIGIINTDYRTAHCDKWNKTRSEYCQETTIKE